MIELTNRVSNCVDALFSEEDAFLAKGMLENDCGHNLPLCETYTPAQMDRIRLAALKLSKGSILELSNAIKLAQIDWRDLLMAAGFARDLSAHENWEW